MERIGPRVCQALPSVDEFQDTGKFQSVMNGRVGRQVRPGESEQGGGRPEPPLLQMDEGARELDQAFVKCVVRTASAFQPEFLQNIVRLIKLPFVEAIEIAQVMGVQITSPKGIDS
jgi:hypothetical protein